MSRVDVLQLRGHDIRTDTGIVVALVSGTAVDATVTDAEGDALFTMARDERWFARDPAGVAILRIDPSPDRFHPVTYADGRTGRFDAAPDAGSWELRDDADGRLVIHARSTGGRMSEWFDWQCAQDGTLTLVDFLATIVAYRGVRTLRHRRGQSVSVDW